MTRSIDWDAARRLVAHRAGWINLNAGTLSPTPLPVLDAVTKLRQMQAEAPSDFHWRVAPRLIQEARRRLAEYLSCDPLDLVLLSNVTFAINLIVSSLSDVLPAGSEILTTDHEYGAMLYCWQRAAERCGWRIKQITLPYRSEDPAEIVNAFTAGITSETRIVFFSHCTTTTGLVLPAQAITRAVRERGRDDLMVVIDGAHAPGMVPVDLRAIGADFYGANCHKWMMAPAGAGFLHVAPQHKRIIQPLITSWGWPYDREKPDVDTGWGGSNWQRNLEFNGTLDRCPQMVLPDTLDFRNRELGGDESTLARSRSIVAHARQLLSGHGFAAITPNNPELSGSLIAFDYPCADVNWFRDAIFDEHHIECPVTTAAGKTFLRVSCGWFNTPDEIDRLAQAAEKLRGGR